MSCDLTFRKFIAKILDKEMVGWKGDKPDEHTGGQAESFQPCLILGQIHEPIAVWEIYLPVYSSVEAYMV